MKLIREMLFLFGAIGVVAWLTFVMAGAVLSVLDRPEVHVQWHSKQCVEVRDPKAEADGRESEWSCDHLPEDYTQVWVY